MIDKKQNKKLKAAMIIRFLCRITYEQINILCIIKLVKINVIVSLVTLSFFIQPKKKLAIHCYLYNIIKYIKKPNLIDYSLFNSV